jgi:hypothetical protein
MPGQRCAVGAGALHSERGDLTVPAGPGQQPPVAGRRGREAGVGQRPTDLVDHGRVVHIAVGVHADGDNPPRAGHARHVVSRSHR